MESIQGFHGIVNLILMPMWFLSGALFPIGGAARGLEILMRANPVTWTGRVPGIALCKRGGRADRARLRLDRFGGVRGSGVRARGRRGATLWAYTTCPRSTPR